MLKSTTDNSYGTVEWVRDIHQTERVIYNKWQKIVKNPGSYKVIRKQHTADIVYSQRLSRETGLGRGR
jgi:glycogen synthase